MNHEPAADLSWLAFQYVSDELPAAEAARFEDRLAGDQAAREAVAEAMLLLQAVAAGEAISAPAAQRRSWMQHAGWAALGAAACLAMVFVIRSLPRDAKVAHAPQLTDLASAELALAWAQRGYGDAAAAEINGEDDVTLAADARDDREFVVPAWMLEALSGPDEAAPAAKESHES